MRRYLLVPAGLLAVAIVLMVLATVSAIRVYDSMNAVTDNGADTFASVTAIHRVWWSGRTSIKVEFTDPRNPGPIYRATVHHATPPGVRVGRQIVITFDTRHPQRVLYTDDQADSREDDAVLLILGSALLVLAAATSSARRGARLIRLRRLVSHDPAERAVSVLPTSRRSRLVIDANEAGIGVLEAQFLGRHTTREATASTTLSLVGDVAAGTPIALRTLSGAWLLSPGRARDRSLSQPPRLTSSGATLTTAALLFLGADRILAPAKDLNHSTTVPGLPASVSTVDLATLLIAGTMISMRDQKLTVIEPDKRGLRFSRVKNHDVSLNWIDRDMARALSVHLRGTAKVLRRAFRTRQDPSPAAVIDRVTAELVGLGYMGGPPSGHPLEGLPLAAKYPRGDAIDARAGEISDAIAAWCRVTNSEPELARRLTEEIRAVLKTKAPLDRLLPRHRD